MTPGPAAGQSPRLQLALGVLANDLGKRRASPRFATRWWIGALQPFVAELASDRAEPFRLDLVRLEITNETVEVDYQIAVEELARDYGLPYSAAWPALLQPVVAIVLLDPPAQDAALLANNLQLPDAAAWASVVARAPLLRLQLGLVQALPDFIRSAHPPRVIWECLFRPPPSFLSLPDRRSYVKEQVQETFATAWQAGKEAKRALAVSLIEGHHIRRLSLGALGFSSAAAMRAAYQQRVERGCNAFVALLLQECRFEGRAPEDWPITGRPPEWRQLAAWWSLNRFLGLSPDRIAQHLSGGLPDPLLAEAIEQGLARLRRLVA